MIGFGDALNDLIADYVTNTSQQEMIDALKAAITQLETEAESDFENDDGEAA
jgi:hypothetical protein